MAPSAEGQDQDQGLPLASFANALRTTRYTKSDIERSETAAIAGSLLFLRVDSWSHYPPRTCLILAGAQR